MRILISGGTGFIGSYVTRLLSKNHTVALLTRPSSNPWRISGCIERVTLISVDLENSSDLNLLVLQFQPDIVLHLAWDGVSSEFRNEPVQESNLKTTMNLLEATIHARGKAWIGLGSQAEYGPHNKKISEQSQTNPTSLYGVTKLAAYNMAERRAADAGVRFAWLRVFSTYGPMDHPKGMIPYLIRTLLKSERPVLTAGEQLWDYLYVADAARAISMVAIDEGAEGVFNLGSGKSLPLRSIIETIRDSINPDLSLGFGEMAYRPDQVVNLEADVGRLMDRVGWAPTTSIAEGIAATIAWDKGR